MKRSIVETKILPPAPSKMMVTFAMPYPRWERLNRAVKAKGGYRKGGTKTFILNELIETWLIKGGF